MLNEFTDPPQNPALAQRLRAIIDALEDVLAAMADAPHNNGQAHDDARFLARRVRLAGEPPDYE